MTAQGEESQDHLTGLLIRWTQGDKEALKSLIPIVYKELRQLARKRLRQERRNQTVQTTTVVHEAYLRLAKYSPRSLRDRKQFFALASEVMRQVLVDQARERLAKKRQGGVRVELTPELAPIAEVEIDVLALDEALRGLERLDPRQSRIVELRFFAGLSIEETSEVLGMSPSTVTRDWLTARAWLQRQLLEQGAAHTAGAGSAS
jgi:RNA polymerase sigma factor (TIGR02999 family)